MNKLQLKWLCGITGAVILAAIGYFYWHYSLNHPATDNAYVNANVIEIASVVGGIITSVNVSDDQFVKQGTVLLKIDPKPYVAAVNQAFAQLLLARQQVTANSAAVQMAVAVVAQRQAEQINAEQNYQRLAPLAEHGSIPKSEGDTATAQIHVANAALLAAKEQLDQAQAQLGVSGEANAQIQAAKAAWNIAEYNLNHTAIIAASDGYVTNLSLRPGTVIVPNQNLFELVENANWWVDANFKETQLSYLQIGLPVAIEVDSCPGHVYQGVVSSISAGSGAAFSLLPPENATGNWVKITQRFPVRIRILQPLAQYPLRVGASAVVTVDATSKTA